MLEVEPAMQYAPAIQVDEPSEPVIITLAVLAVAIGALAASTSAALEQLSEGKKTTIVDRGQVRGTRSLAAYLENPEKYDVALFTIRIVAQAVFTLLLASIWKQSSNWMLLIVAVASYAIPMHLAVGFSRARAASIAGVLLAFCRPFIGLVFPLAVTMRLLRRLVSKVDRARPDTLAAESEVEALVDRAERSGAFDPEQSEMLRNVLDFRELTAGDVMVPRIKVCAIDERSRLKEAFLIISEQEHSRYPVYRERIDNVVGILYAKDLLLSVTNIEQSEIIVGELMRREVVYVPESQSASSVLKEMRTGKRHHIAVVLDEFGGMSGIVSLEDLVEEIVGDIRDEYDEELPLLQRLPEGGVLIDAAMSVVELNRELELELPETGDYHSVGGFLVEKLGELPRAGARLQFGAIEFTVKEASEGRIESVALRFSENS